MKRSVTALGVVLLAGVWPVHVGAHSAPAHRHWNGYTFYATRDQYVPAPFDREWGEFVPQCAVARPVPKKARRSKVYREED